MRSSKKPGALPSPVLCTGPSFACVHPSTASAGGPAGAWGNVRAFHALAENQHCSERTAHQKPTVRRESSSDPSLSFHAGTENGTGSTDVRRCEHRLKPPPVYSLRAKNSKFKSVSEKLHLNYIFGLEIKQDRQLSFESKEIFTPFKNGK